MTLGERSMCRFIFQLSTIYAILNVCLVSSDCEFDSVSEKESGKRLSELQAQTKEKPISIQDSQKNYTYSIGICSPVKAPNVGVTQTENFGDHIEHNLGLISKAHIQFGSNWIFLQYHNGDPYGGHCKQEGRQSHIMIICDEKNELVGNKVVLEENNNRTEDCYYLFEITSSIACSEHPSSGLSLGSILIILFVCVIFVYILGGFVYQRFIIGAKGMEQFPNIAFWRDFGNLVADGCDCVFRTKPKSEPKLYKGIGDDQLGLDEDEEQDDHLLPM
ncbi:cation-dependent mannose-6-phosphate receptor-like isoform X2 [Anneissia japonica]|uniref:cation-dependent mannose-6-phosphate receptor-like isoform X2 n=1 Tax=Anneissia japonica TaxID=1529436 RepID=UPI001425B0E6|nr:cation-dependent mannose-6-phosphate receptor-like isoform X2 [Anneissia japonica]